MNTEHLLDAMGLLDDDLIREAEEYRRAGQRAGRWIGLAASFAVVLVLGYGMAQIRLGNGGGMNSSGAAPAASDYYGCDQAAGEAGPPDPEPNGEPVQPGAAASQGGGEVLSPEKGNWHAAIMVDGVLYWSTETPVPGEVDESVIRPVTGYTSALPEMDGQTNFSPDLSAVYAVTADGLVVRMDNEWVLFEPAPNQ